MRICTGEIQDFNTSIKEFFFLLCGNCHILPEMGSIPRTGRFVQ